MAYTTTEVVHFFECDESALPEFFMDGSDDDMGMEDVGEVYDPYNVEFPDIQELDGE